MNQKRVFLIGTAILFVSCVVLFNFNKRHTNHLAKSASENSESFRQKRNAFSNSATQPVLENPISDRDNFVEKLGSAWGQESAEPSSAQFFDWSRKYAGASVQEKLALEKEGVRSAAERRVALEKLIQADPERALENVVPISVRRGLPDSIKELLEERISGRGELAVLAALPEPGKELDIPATFRTAKIEGREFNAFTYGRRLGEPTKHNIALNGIAIGDSLAVNENPVRILEAAEAAEILKKSEAICAVSGDATTANNDETAVEVGDEIIFLCRRAHADDLNQQIVAAEGGAPTEGDAEPSTYTEGQKNLLLIRVDFPDLVGVPFSDSTGTNLINGMNSFWRDCSYHRASFTPVGQGSVYTPTFRMPNNASSYGNSNLYNLLRTHARAAATNAGYVLSDYNFDVICMGLVPGWTWGGLGYVGQPGSWVRSSTFSSHGVMAHEVGHNYGLNHANFWDTYGLSIIGTTGTNIEYGDNLDTMGSASAGNNHFNARYKRYLNWLTTNEITNVTVSGTYRIFCHDNTNSTGLRAISTHKTGTATNYWIEFRQKFTSNKWSMSGVGIRWAHTNISNNGKSLLLDTTPDSDPNSTTDKNDGALVIGRTLSDKVAGVHITPIGKGGTTPESIDVVINRGTFPTNVLPTITISASATNVAASTTVNFTATASDSNGDTLAYYWDFGDTNFGTNGPTASKSWSASAEYVVRCKVTDMKGGTASDSVIIRVGSPTTFRISGTVMTNGTPIESVRIFVPASNRLTYTDSDGTYNLVGLPAASYTVNAQLDGYTCYANFYNPISVGPNKTNINFTTSLVLPAISVQPQGKSVAVGSNVTFNVTATGDVLNYRWRSNGVVIATTTNASFTLMNVQSSHAGNYSVIVSNAAASITSSNATLVVNVPPVITAISNRMVLEGALLSFTVNASDANTLTFGLEPGAPTGASIHPQTGVFSWTPNELQGSGNYNIFVRVVDNGIPVLSATNSFLVTVTESNSAPILTAISNKFVNAGATLVFTNTASDSDWPTNILTFSLGANALADATIGASSGVFSWIAPDSEILITNSINIFVTDNGVPVLSNSKSFEIVIIPPPQVSSVTKLSDGSITLTWQTFPGKTYRVQYKDDLEGSDWINYDAPMLAVGVSLSITDNSSAGQLQRFYRIVQLD